VSVAAAVLFNCDTAYGICNGADAAQATFSLVLNRPQSFSLLEDVGKAVAR
jgi:hypothetical protein